MLNSFTALKDTLIIRVYLNSFPGIPYFQDFSPFLRTWPFGTLNKLLVQINALKFELAP